jgi:predicted RNA-binding Zn ribbon-like protein
VVTKRATELELVGGDPALDFANTVDGAFDDPIESLHDYGDLAAWAAYAGVIDGETAERLAAAAGRRPEEAARALDRARALRIAIYRTFSAVAHGTEPPAVALDALRAAHAGALERARLEPDFSFTWEGEDLDRPLWPLAVAAVDLLRTGPLDRLKTCAECPWLFLDSSRNRSRRWCSMNECGGRLKMRRYRERRATAGR